MDASGRSASNRRFVLGTLAGAVAGVVLVIGALGLVQPKSSTAASPRPSTPSTAKAGSTVVVPPASPSVTSPSAKPTSASATPTGEQTHEEGLATPEAGTWFALVRWMPKSSYDAAEALDYASNRSGAGVTMVVVDTDAVTLRGGKSGQYAVGLSGLASMEEATAACRSLGLTPGSQCGRFEIT